MNDDKVALPNPTPEQNAPAPAPENTPPAPAAEKRESSLKFAPKLPSDTEVAEFTKPAEIKPNLYGVQVKREPSDTATRDPLFAAHVLEEEMKRPADETFASISRTISSEKSPAVEKSSIRRLRTYNSDVAETIQNQKTSVVQMVLAEGQRKQMAAEEASPKNPRNIILITLSILLGISALGVVGFVAWQYVQKQDEARRAVLSAVVPGIIFSEVNTPIDVTDMTGEEAARAIRTMVSGATARLDFIEQIYLTKKVSTDTGVADQTLTTGEFFTLVASDIPDSLARSLSPEFFFGVHIFNGNEPFMILKTNYFESAFAGMLKWEQTLPKQLLPLFDISVAPELLAAPHFEDIVLRNRDVRALRDENGNFVLFYLFPDKNTVVIATSDATIKEVIDRLQRYQAR